MVKLWENPSTENTFAPQTIALDLSEYNFVAILFSGTTSMFFARIGSGDTWHANEFVYSGKAYTVLRSVTPTAKGVKFGEGYLEDYAGNLTAENVRAQPRIIYGIKTSLKPTGGSISGVSIEKVYPVGAVYISTVATNPAELFGFGTWQQIKDTFLLAAGDSYAAGATGGEAKHTLTVGEMPSHAHPINYNNTSGGVPFPAYHAVITEYQVSAGVYNSANTAMVGDSQPHNNMPPYLAVYVWQRTA